MPASEARIVANRQNSLKSTGPKSVEGKERSRQNGLKHGLTGQGVVVSSADSDEVSRRTAVLQAEMAPQTALGSVLVAQIALLSVRMERGAKQESASLASRVRHASEDFDDARFDEAERLLDVLGEDPRIHLRKLRKSPEGVERLIVAWQELRADLTRESKPLWTAAHREKAENLSGRRIDDAQGSRFKALSEATWGNFGLLGDDEGGDLDDHPRQAWARARLVERIDAEIAALEIHYDSLDFETIELDRAEAGDRALFDTSKEATLARRYEAASQRAFFKALGEFRKVEAEALDRPSTSDTPEIVEAEAPLASSCNGPAPTSRMPLEDPLTPARSVDSRGVETARTHDEGVMTIGRPNSGPA